ncbi:MAG TPA: GNAT family N-acetyltransferase [Polyangiaceae bacterium]|nr:GNAT family N-acetyltransferase [Polyangiaceae bacterium]
MTLRCTIATTKRELDHALKLRWQVFSGEMRLLAPTSPLVEREVDLFDTLESTVHFLVYSDETPVGTVRLLFPSEEVADANRWRIGIDLERKFDLDSLVAPGVRFAEATRLCILRERRRGAVLALLVEAMRRESMRRGVTHWVAAANTETDSKEDAHITYRVAESIGLVSERWRVTPRIVAPPPPVPLRPFYGPLERERAARDEMAGLRLPKPLALYALKMGARYVGEPTYDARFRAFSMPLVAPVACGTDASVGRAPPETGFEASAGARPPPDSSAFFAMTE